MFHSLASLQSNEPWRYLAPKRFKGCLSSKKIVARLRAAFFVSSLTATDRKYEVLVHVLVIVASIACFSSFVWGMKAFFVMPTRVPYGVRMLQGLGALYFVLYTFIVTKPGAVTGITAWIGLMFLGISFSLFWWTIRTNRTKRFGVGFSFECPDAFSTKGPYRLIRHPFYLSYSLGWTGAAMAVGNYCLLYTSPSPRDS